MTSVRDASNVIFELMQETHKTAVEHGFIADGIERDPLVLIALLVSELGELVDACRKPGPSEHIPTFTNIEEEAADILIRLLQMSNEMRLDLPEAMFAKMAFNNDRPYRHGGKLY